MMKTIGLVIALGMVSSLAGAQGKQDPLEACYQQPDGAPRLACFNQEMQRRQAAATPSAQPSAAAHALPATPAAPAASALSPAAPAAKSTVDDTVGLQGSELRHKLKAEGRAPDVQPIVATVVRMLGRPDNNEHVFVLDNGQRWEQAEAMDNLNVRLNDTVTIKPGVLGAFFLNTPRSQRVRVRRIL